MEKEKFHNTYSLESIMKKLIMISIPVIIINIAVSAISIINIRHQNLQNINDTITLYQERISEKFNAIEHFTQWVVVREPLIESLETAETVDDEIKALESLRIRTNDNQYSIGSEYQYFLYLEEQDLFCNASAMQSSYEDYLLIKSFMIEQIKSGISVKDNFTWKSLEIDDVIYLYYMITFGNRTFAVFVNMEDLIAPLSNLQLGRYGLLVVTDAKGNSLFVSYDADTDKMNSTNSILYSLLTYTGADYSLPFDIKLYSDNFSNNGGLLFFNLFIVIVALFLCFILSGLVFYIYKRVIRPIQAFSDNLSDINDQEIINLESNQIRELENASIQFRNLIREIRRLKISVYENELKQNRLQITFLQNQIRPHFYLNCLTTISSMAQLGNNKDIESMVLFTSQYLRYLFQTDKEKVPIKYELQHIQAYLDIQAMRYGPIFTYDCTIEKEAENALTPPLLLITFIENAIKHGIPQDGQLHITLSVQKIQMNEKTCLKTEITDSGQGFSKEILDKLAHGENLVSDEISHIGISNNMQRLNLLYGTDYQIRFFNGPDGGAHIYLVLPFQI